MVEESREADTWVERASKQSKEAGERVEYREAGREECITAGRGGEERRQTGVVEESREAGKGNIASREARRK